MLLGGIKSLDSQLQSTLLPPTPSSASVLESPAFPSISTMTYKRKREHRLASPVAIKREDPDEQSLTTCEAEEKKTGLQDSFSVPASQRDIIVITDNEEPLMAADLPATSEAGPISAEDQPLLNIEQCFKKEHLW